MARLKEDAWDKPTLKRKEVEIPELGGSLLVQELGADLVAEIQSHLRVELSGTDQVVKVDKATMERLQFAHGVIRDDGSQMYTEEKVAEIAGKHGRPFLRVIEALDEMSGINKEEIEKTTARFPSGGDAEEGPDAEANSPRSGGEGRNGASAIDGSAVPARAGAQAGDAG